MTVELQHKRDVDEFEDGCLTEARFVFEKNEGCVLEVLAGDRLDDQERLDVLSVTFSANSQCPSFSDAVEGTYVASDPPGSGVVMSTPRVPGQNVAESCFEATFVVQLSGELKRESDGEPLQVSGTALQVSGKFLSIGDSVGSCPCNASCAGKQCGDDGCGGTCGSCSSDIQCVLVACESGKCKENPSDALCDDGQACTTDSCDPALGCTSVSNVDCDDGDACTDDSCDAVAGCVYSAVSCDDANVCTKDVCNPATGCEAIPQSGPCGNGAECVAGECCTASCAGKVCGDDGCGGTCGSCAGTLSCVGGSCQSALVLSGTANSNYPKLMKAFAECWIAGKLECDTIDATGLSQDISEPGLSSWFCSTATPSDVGGQPNYTAGKDIMGCGTFDLDDFTILTGSIHKGLSGVECFGRKNGNVGGNIDANLKELVVGNCGQL